VVGYVRVEISVQCSWVCETLYLKSLLKLKTQLPQLMD